MFSWRMIELASNDTYRRPRLSTRSSPEAAAASTVSWVLSTTSFDCSASAAERRKEGSPISNLESEIEFGPGPLWSYGGCLDIDRLTASTWRPNVPECNVCLCIVSTGHPCQHMNWKIRNAIWVRPSNTASINVIRCKSIYPWVFVYFLVVWAYFLLTVHVYR